MKNKIKLDEIVVVEGKDDITNLSKVIDATIISLNGSSGLNSKKIDNIKALSKNNKIILLTDPDYTGKKIRRRINENISNIINLYATRNKASKDDKIGVEYLKEDDIYEIFDGYKKASNVENLNYNKLELNMLDFIEIGLSGQKDSKMKREILGDILNIGYYNSKMLLNVLNSMNISKCEFNEALSKMKNILDREYKIGIIFGKFLPAHKGHINFIKESSKEVDKLYVLLCVEKERDRNLIFNSTLPKNITEKNRYDFLKKDLETINNVEILSLREEGITYYPNGWKEWTERVEKLLISRNIFINVVFTNEIQDKENYEKYFVNTKVFSKGLDVILKDPNRYSVNISSTMIRNDFNKYKDFLTENVLKFFENK